MKVSRADSRVSRVGNDVAFLHDKLHAVYVNIESVPPLLFLQLLNVGVDFVVKFLKMCVCRHEAVRMPDIQHFAVSVRRKTNAKNIPVSRGIHRIPFLVIGRNINAFVKMCSSKISEGGSNNRACVCRPDVICDVGTQRIEGRVNIVDM